ncbi:hypothetical protein IFO70_36780 [Phormidium tenue FACHB-886]|nr:hypothetical protein [Phormidium tenue FACHB-886]
MSVALKVRNSANSTVALGEPGAEKLLGKGDMLVNLGNRPERMQAPLIGGQTTIKEAIAARGVEHVNCCNSTCYRPTAVA